MKKKVNLIAAVLILFFIPLHSQSIEDLYMARDDAQTYLQHYLSPVMRGLLYDINNGWYHTAKTHKLFGFEVDFTVTAGIVPKYDKMFLFNSSEYNYLSLSSGSSSNLPTIAGDQTSTVMDLNYNGSTAQLDAMDGLGYLWPVEIPYPISFPAPMVQTGVGLPLGTDLTIRFLPNMENNGVKFGMLGLGLKHSLSQYFGKGEEEDSKFPVNISALGAFTRTKVTYVPDDTGIPGANQEMTLNLNAYTFQLIADKKVAIIDFYGGIGYTAGISGVDVNGTYEFDMNANGTIENDEIVRDPVSLQYQISGMRATLGADFALGPVHVFADYTFQEYQALTIGLAGSF